MRYIEWIKENNVLINVFVGRIGIRLLEKMFSWEGLLGILIGWIYSGVYFFFLFKSFLIY